MNSTNDRNIDFINNLYELMKSEYTLSYEQEMIDILKSVIYILRSENKIKNRTRMEYCISHFFTLYCKDRKKELANTYETTQNVMKYGEFNRNKGNTYIKKVIDKIEKDKLEAERKEQEKKEAIERARLEKNRIRLEKEAQIRANTISKNIDKECTNKNITIYFSIAILLFFLGFAAKFIFVFCFIWAIVGGIVMMMVKLNYDIEKKKQEWKSNHPNDIAGRYL